MSPQPLFVSRRAVSALRDEVALGEMQMGVYRGNIFQDRDDAVANYETWLGRTMDYVEDFIPADDWSAIEGTGGSGWWRGPSPRTMVWGVPMFPSGGTLAAGAAGTYDSHFTALATHLIDDGQGDSILRLGWEFGGGWFAWGVDSSQKATDFAAYWRRIVNAMRAVSGAAFKFDFNGIWGGQPVSPEAAYPGNAYVDYIGFDIYDQSWIPDYTSEAARWLDCTTTNNYSIEWWASFAASKNKPLSVPEWGLSIRDDGHGGGDAPSFITHMADWMASKNVAYHVYFEVDVSDGTHMISDGGTADGMNFPNALTVFKTRF